MKRILPLVLLVVAAASLGRAAAEKPNVIVILADDLGYADLGVQGARDIPTPNLDRLAAQGARCTQGYVTWGACAPSRASLLTGQDSHRFGFYTNPTPVLAVDQGLPPGIMTVPRALQGLGYVTGGIGKWHLGTTPDRHPNRMGFTHWFGFRGGAHEYFPRRHYPPLPALPWRENIVNQTMPIDRNGGPAEWSDYFTDAVTGEAVNFIAQNRERPFFLYLAYNAPHSPYEAPPEEEAKLDPAKLTALDGIPPRLRRTYAAMVSRLDHGVGQVLGQLNRLGLDERTLVFFLSDNGGGPNRNEKGAPHYPSSNAPLRGFKGSLLEGGIRVPFFVRWTGVIAPGTVYRESVSSLDIGTTAMALAGRAPAGLRLDGVNLLPYLTGAQSGVPHARLYWKQNARGAIREGRFKLHTGESMPNPELYDLDADLAESRNLAAQHPEIVQRLHASWAAWNAEMKPPLWTTPPREQWTLPEYQPKSRY